MADWLQFAADSGLSVPHRLLPALLTLAEARPAVAAQLFPAIGSRGRWLQELLSTASGAAPPAPADWSGLKAADAATELEQLRRSDPAAARDRLAEHWDSISAKERAAHLGILGTGLGPDDEVLLERALDDKAKTVRDAASALLDRLPASARAQRMAARLTALLRVKGLLRKQFEIDLPPEPDPAACATESPRCPAPANPTGWGGWTRSSAAPRWTSGPPSPGGARRRPWQCSTVNPAWWRASSPPRHSAPTRNGRAPCSIFALTHGCWAVCRQPNGKRRCCATSTAERCSPWPWQDCCATRRGRGD